jgi:hypothetical protein
MPYWIQHSFSYSAFFPFLVGLWRYRQLDARYLPFLILIWTGAMNDQVSYLSGKLFRTNAPNSNLWFLTEVLLCIWSFHCWRLFRNSRIPRALAAAFTVLWLLETFVLRNIFDFSVYSHILFAFSIVLMSVQYINKLIVTEQQLTLRNGDFLICISLVIFNSTNVLTECFWLYGYGSDKVFAAQVFSIVTITNLISNVIFGFALLWIPRKQVFLQLS